MTYSLRASSGAAASPPSSSSSSSQCHLISGPFADFVQLSLAVLALGSLIVKRFQETPPRPWLIWSMDVSKQGLGALHAHFLNMLVAIGLASLTGGSDECAWYFWNYLVDCTVGLVLSILIIKLLECWASRYPANSWQRLYIANSGDYGTPPSGRTWGCQTAVWLGIVSAAKLGLFFFLLAFRQGFNDWGHWIFKPLRGHPQAELVIVMVVVPGILNTLQFWAIDNVIMSRPISTPTAPLSPTKDSFKVSYRPMLDGSGGSGSGGAMLRGASPQQRRRSSAKRWWWPFSSSSSSSATSRPSRSAASMGDVVSSGRSSSSSSSPPPSSGRGTAASMDSLGELMDDINGSSGGAAEAPDRFYSPPRAREGGGVSSSSSSSGGQHLNEPAWISENGIRLNRRNNFGLMEGGGFL